MQQHKGGKTMTDISDKAMERAYCTLAKHSFIAYRKYEGEETIIIFANDIDEATKKAVEFFGLNSVQVRKLEPTKDPQVYKI